MIVIVKDSARPEQIEKLKENFESMGLQVHFSKGMNTTLLGLVSIPLYVLFLQTVPLFW